MPRVEDKIRDLLEKGVDRKGHHYSDKDFQRFLEFLKKDIHVSFLEWVQKRFEEEGKIDPPVPFALQTFDCSECGESLRPVFDGEKIFLENEICPFSNPDDIHTEFEINIPSGKIVVTDDLREWFPEDNKNFEINSTIGCHQKSMWRASVGVATGFVGNSSPRVFFDGEQYFIGDYLEEVWNSETNTYINSSNPCTLGEEKASICTDLWWYSIADLEEFERRRIFFTPNKSFQDLSLSVVNISPGVYRFTNYHRVDQNQNEYVFATFKKIREPEPERNFLAEDLEFNPSATEVLLQTLFDHPYLGGYSNVPEWESAADFNPEILARVADYLLISGNINWHPNGFPRCTISEKTKRIAREIGEIFFHKKQFWSSPSKDYSKLCAVAGLSTEQGHLPLNPSFLRLCLNICQCAVQSGVDCSHGARDRTNFFARCYRALRENYPEVVLDENFDHWMKRKHVVQRHIGALYPSKK